MKDEILTELWEVKDELARANNYDIDKLFDYFSAAESSAPYLASDYPVDSELTPGVEPTSDQK